MNFIKNKLVWIVLVASIGCAFESDDENKEVDKPTSGIDTVVPTPNLKKDSDGDGLTDDIDPRPYMADVPNVNIYRLYESSIKLKLDDKGLNTDTLVLTDSGGNRRSSNFAGYRNERLIERVLDLHYQKMTNPHFGPENVKNRLDLRTIFSTPLSQWKDQNLYPFVHNIKNNEGTGALPNTALVESSVSLEVFKADGVTKLTEIDYALSDDALDWSSGDVFRLTDNDGNMAIFEMNGASSTSRSSRAYKASKVEELKTVVSSLEKRSELAMEIADFKYTLHNKELKLSETLPRIESKTAMVVIFDGEKVDYEFVTARGSVEDVFKSAFDNVIFDDQGRLLTVDGSRNELSFNTDFNELDELKLKQLSVTLIGASNGHEKVEGGGVYIASKAKGKELARMHQSGTVITKSEESRIVDLGKFYPGQKLDLKVFSKRSTPRVTKRNVSVKVSFNTISIPRPKQDESINNKSIAKRRAWGDFTAKEKILSWTGYSSLNLKSGNHIDSILIDDEVFPLDIMLVEQNEMAFVQEGKVSKFRLKVPSSLKRAVSVKVVFKKEKQHSVGLGLIDSSWKSVCDYDMRSSCKLEGGNYSNRAHTKNLKTKTQNNVEFTYLK